MNSCCETGSDCQKAGGFMARIAALYGWVAFSLDRFLLPLVLLGIRLLMAQVFWYSGVAKATSMSGTVELFTYLYHVPLLPPVFAAYSSTVGEIGFAVLLAVGLAGRLSAFAVIVINTVALYSYSGNSAAGIMQQHLWTWLLFVIVAAGPGVLSLDGLIVRLLKGRTSEKQDQQLSH